MEEGIMQRWWDSSHLFGGSSAYLDEQYEAYLRDPSSVDERWRTYFDALPVVDGVSRQDIPHSEIREQFRALVKNKNFMPQDGATGSHGAQDLKQMYVSHLVAAYRRRGHQQANLDPLGLATKDEAIDLDLRHHHLTEADYDTEFASDAFFGQSTMSLREIHEALQQTYCSSIGSEFTHITNTEEQEWLARRLESARSHPTYDKETKLRLLKQLTAAEGIEKYIHTKFPGTKRFSLEGGESLIPILDELIYRSARHGVKEIVIGMAHRGRLNALVNILGKQPAELFDEFAGNFNFNGSGDVKYHQGFSSDLNIDGSLVHLALAFNPSHLEIVSPVVVGSVRARQERRHDHTHDDVLAINVHGDSAFAGQGVVMETFNMSQARGYTTGGTVHIVVNNQIGFTTSNPNDTRSSRYCTDIAKSIEAPIFHVNADDPEAVLFVTQIAADYRKQFKRDVVIDLICYRRHGHNEADEPRATQPLMYSIIRKHKTTRTQYADRLADEGTIDKAQAAEMVTAYRDALDHGECVIDNWVPMQPSDYPVNWSPYLNIDWDHKVDTKVDVSLLQSLGDKLCDYPDGFEVQKQVSKLVDDRRKMAAGALPLNWGMAESLAYATLLEEGYRVRISGQDSGRGTFSHRHSVLHNQKDGSEYVPLKNLSDDQATFMVIDSVLSEEAVLAFEYGYATAEPRALVIWEAQFGDFANGAQVVIDQFISSGEHKWGRLCGLVMFLPHGYEGQGPEHSSARLERYLQLCAEHNMQVCIPSTPAQTYHMIRRQMIRPMRRPLVVMTPKSLLRHRAAVSTLEELADGEWQNAIGEVDSLDPKNVRRVVMCSGKVYYDLIEQRREKEVDDVAIIRIEQLYPFPADCVKKALEPFVHAKDFVWCQEEPMNQGAWYSSQHHFWSVLPEGGKLTYAGREASAAPAAGYMSLHVEQLQQFINDALLLDN
jgi:2-oxoglutarate dehydrogenase E1 component